MAKKKIMLFIVEGPTEETSLSTVLSRIFSSDTVRFQVVHGDILTKDFVTPDKIVAAVNEQVKQVRENIYKPSDFCKIIHLADMDGVFIPDDVVLQEQVEGRVYSIYTETNILSNNRQGILDRNERKRKNMIRLSSCKKINGISYSLYYFSCNLEHVLHGRNNLNDEEKIILANSFDLKYADEPDAFIHFMRDESFAVPGEYSETWKFIKEDLHSLERYSNFGLALPDKSEWQQSKTIKSPR